jgi:hypothetical protein
MSAADPTVDTADGGHRTRSVIISVLVASVLGLLAWGWGGTGDGAIEFASEPVPTGAEVPADGDDAAALAAELDGEPLVVTYEVLLERDPFDPVVPRPASEVETAAAVSIDADGVVLAEPASDAEAIGDEVPSDGAWSEPVPQPAPQPVADEPSAPVATGDCDAQDDVVVCDGRAVSLVRIVSETDGRRVAVLQVDTSIHEVEKGEVFATSFRLRTVGADRVTVQYGDVEFELPVGARVLK